MSLPDPLPAAEGAPRVEKPALAPHVLVDFNHSSDVPFVARAALYAAIALIAVAVIWASVTELDIVVSADGAIDTTAPMIVLQPFDPSIIRGIAVRAGDRVRAGEPLITLDPTLVKADLTEAKSKLDLGQAMLRRIDAELAGRVYSPQSQDAAELIQKRIFEERSGELDARRRLLAQKVRELDAQLKEKVAEEPHLREQIGFLKQAVEVYVQLHQSGNTTILKELEARRQLADLEAKLAENQGYQEALNEKIKSEEADFSRWVSERRRELMDDYADQRMDSDSAAASLAKAGLREKLVSLRAPADGVVLSVAERSIGSVAQQGETLLTVVPKDATLVAEIQVRTRDVGRVKIGDPAVIKLETLPFERYGYLEGTVKVISPDVLDGTKPTAGGAELPSRSVDPKESGQQPYFLVRVSIEKIGLRNVPSSFSLRPGMKVTTDIKVGTRSVLEYIVDPFKRGFEESMHEP